MKIKPAAGHSRWHSVSIRSKDYIWLLVLYWWYTNFWFSVCFSVFKTIMNCTWHIDLYCRLPALWGPWLMLVILRCGRTWLCGPRVGDEQDWTARDAVKRHARMWYHTGFSLEEQTASGKNIFINKYTNR